MSKSTLEKFIDERHAYSKFFGALVSVDDIKIKAGDRFAVIHEDHCPAKRKRRPGFCNCLEHVILWNTTAFFRLDCINFDGASNDGFCYETRDISDICQDWTDLVRSS